MTKPEQKAYQRQSILKDILYRKLNFEQYVKLYNSGEIPRTRGIPVLSTPTLYRWKKNYTECGVGGLVPAYNPTRGAGARSLRAEDIRLIQTYYFDKNRPSLAHALRLIERYHERKISYDTARRYINSLPQALLVRERQGAKTYNDKAAPYIKRDYDALHPMQIVSADHHILDLLCRHPHKGTPFRPWLTMIMDYRSRKPLGWTIGITPNRYSILSALEECVENYGSPDEIHIDNGKDFRSKLLNGEKIKIKNADAFGEKQTIELQGVFERLGTLVHFSTPYRAQAKPVERFFRVVAETFSKEFPSYVGSNSSDRPEDIALYYRRIKGQEKRGDLLDLDDVAALFNLWSERYAAEHQHRGRGMNGRTPNQVFQEEATHPRPVMPQKLRHLVFADQYKRTVTRHGIHIEGTDYYADEIAGHIGKELIARRPFRSRQIVIVFSPDGRQLFTARGDYMNDTGDARENSRLRSAVNRKQKEILAQHLQEPTPRESLLGELSEARKAVGDDDIVDIHTYTRKTRESESQSKFFEGVLKWTN